jgi:hypothetical protein
MIHVCFWAEPSDTCSRGEKRGRSSKGHFRGWSDVIGLFRAPVVETQNETANGIPLTTARKRP